MICREHVRTQFLECGRVNQSVTDAYHLDTSDSALTVHQGRQGMRG